MTPQVEIIPAPNPEVAQRAAIVLAEILTIKNGLHENMFTLAEKLHEARQGNYHLNWGYSRFSDWVESGSGLDISARTAVYLVNIVDKSRQLGLSRDDIKGVKISKLKEIFSLDTEKNKEEIKGLLADSENKSLEEVREAVWAAKTDGVGEPLVYITIKMAKSVKTEIVDVAFNMVRKEIGDTIGADGEVTEASAGRCIEYICAEWMQAPERIQEHQIPEEEA